ncbi:flagellar brake protein [Desulfurobacterium atlanticum]|uniref:PilZ domain-containing protein n=1 Tax=Desulfurobacterium atlanticum TaxID=240169 RepID=A0A238Y2Q4_9BACT|nr:PilZ domain-containing protein [Desulfurobacterium atlanticum]SNR64599.1 PilZ domain-containing protein [Desulfurobacterium atlanticum]
MGELKDHILKWLKDRIDKKQHVEVISFYNEVPVHVKLVPTSVEGFKTVGWESNPKLIPAVDQTQAFYIPFVHPVHKEREILSAGVLYYGKDYIETTFPSFSIDPRFKRNSVRIKVSDLKPVIVRINDGEKTLTLRALDISEGGVGVEAEKGTFSLNEELMLDLKFPDGKEVNNIFGKVVNVESLMPDKKKEKAGIAFLKIREKDKDVINRYIVQRQKEIINEFKMFCEE